MRPLATGPQIPLLRAGATWPLAGMVVLFFALDNLGRYATLLMAKAGADVIKIEPRAALPYRGMHGNHAARGGHAASLPYTECCRKGFTARPPHLGNSRIPDARGRPACRSGL